MSIAQFGLQARLRRIGAALNPLFRFGPNSPLWGSGGTFTRATTATYTDPGLLVATAASGVRRNNHMAYAGTMQQRYLSTLLEGARTNLVVQSEDFSTTWTAVASPSVTHPGISCGTLNLDLLEDDSAAANERFEQTITFTGDAVKAISLFMKQGTTTTTGILLYDQTAGSVDRLRATITWSAGVPSVAMGTGTQAWTPIPLSNGIYRFGFITSAVTAANTNKLRVAPATDAADSAVPTGTLYAGGIQAENAAFPSSYIPTTTAAVTRNADVLSYPFPYAPREMTVYLRFVDGVGSATGTTVGLIIGTASGSLPTLQVYHDAGKWVGYYVNGGSASTSTAADSTAIGDLVELRVTLSAGGAVTLGQTINGGTEAVAATGTARGMATAWNGSPVVFEINSGAGAAQHFAAYATAIAIPGVQSLAACRAAAGV